MASQYDSGYFVASVSNTARKCASLSLRKTLIKHAVRKNGEKKDDPTPENLLFPPTVIKDMLSRERVEAVLRCQCRICKHLPGGRDRLIDTPLNDAVTGTGDRADVQRRLFATLIFMGTGFAARRVCSFHTSGSELTTQQVNSLREELFRPLQNLSILPSDVDVANIFKEIFERTMQIFAAPKFEIGSIGTDLRGKNLPFINTVEMGKKADKSSFGRLIAFQIHPEFRDLNIPAKLVRKELVFNHIHNEERQILEFLAICKQPNLIRLLFWYRYEDKINFVFPHYPGSLQQVLEGKMQEPDRARLPGKYVGSKLQHWLWQGMVDVIAALKFFHSPEDPGLGLGLLIAAHFDLKPANVLIDDDGTLIVTDFGQARIAELRSSGQTSLSTHFGDLNYRPPPLGPPVMEPAAGPGSVDEYSWSRAYDVWSIACIVTEVIEYITNGGPDGFKSFRDSRRREDESSIAFWKPRPDGGYELRQSVRRTLGRFRSYNDRYLNTVTNLLEVMFSIQPVDRLPLADCLAVILSDVRMDDWPFLDNENLSFSDPGPNHQLRNMCTKYKHEADIHPHRCKIYTVPDKNPDRIRVVVEFDREVKGQTVTYVVPDPAIRAEEEYKLLSLFDPNYKPIDGQAYLGAFGIMHPSLTFIFDDHRLGLEEYYSFFTAMTRQRCLNQRIHIPISGCQFLESRFAGKVKVFSGGHVQIWRELTEDEYYDKFTNVPMTSAPNSPTSSQFLSRGLSQSSPRSPDSIATPFSSINLGLPVEASTEATPYRLVIFLPGSPISCLTLNLTSKFNKIQRGLTANAVKSSLHVTIKTLGGNFFISNLSRQQGCPGIPLNPDVLERSESTKVAWVELTFSNSHAVEEFVKLCTRLQIL